MTAYSVIGTDVSIWDDNNSTPQVVDFEKMVQAGAKFTFVKSSQANWIDQDYITNWSNAKQAGILRGAYHYLTFDVSPIIQAEYVWSILRADPGELPIVCDFECRTGATRSTAAGALKAFLERLKTLSGRTPMIYTSPGYWREFGTTDTYWTAYPLWLAHYTTGNPDTPLPWRWWYFWQYTDRGDGVKYGGEAKMMDMNYWKASLEDLYLFAGKPTPPPAPESWQLQIDAWARMQGYTGVRP